MQSKKELLCQTAMQLISENPSDLSAVTVSAVAAAAGIGKGTVYEYFSSKDELLCEAVLFHMRGLMAEIGDIADSGDTFNTKLKVMLEAVIRAESGSGMLMRFLLESSGGQDKQFICEGLRRFRDENMERTVEVVGRLIRQGIEEKEVSEDITEADVWYCCISIAGFITTVMSDETLSRRLGLEGMDLLSGFCHQKLKGLMKKGDAV